MVGRSSVTTDSNSSSMFHIALPYGGNFEYLKETLLSVRSQTFANWQLTILDDDSRTQELCTYVEGLNDSRINLIQFTEKKGIIKIYEESTKYLHAEWNLILNADDILDVNFLSEIVSIPRETLVSVDIIQPAVKVIDSYGKRLVSIFDVLKKMIRGRRKSRLLTNRNTLFKICLGNWLYFPSILWNRRIIPLLNFDNTLPITFDFKLLAELFLKNKLVYVSQEPTFFYRRHKKSNSMSDSNSVLRAREERIVFNFLSTTLKEKGKYAMWTISKIRMSNRLFIVYSILTNKKFLRTYFSKQGR